MERDVPELRGIVIVMSRATRVINVQQYNIFVLLSVVQWYRQVPRSKCCNTVQYICNICPVWLDSLNASIIIHFLFSCTQLVFLQCYCIIHWLSFRHVSSYKKVIFFGQNPSFTQLPCLLNSLLINFVPFPSLPPFGGVVVV